MLSLYWLITLYLKLEVDVWVSECTTKIRLDHLCWIGEGIVGGCQGWRHLVAKIVNWRHHLVTKIVNWWCHLVAKIVNWWRHLVAKIVNGGAI